MPIITIFFLEQDDETVDSWFVYYLVTKFEKLINKLSWNKKC